MRKYLQIAEMRGGNRHCGFREEMQQYRPRQCRAFGGVGAGAEFIQQYHAFIRRLVNNAADIGDMPAEGGERLFNTLLIADIDENTVEDRNQALFRGRNGNAGQRHQAEQADGFQCDGFATGIGAGNH